ncbi:MAG: hypothetical protein C0594_08780 [Marinilabiliales bacterium]|nr:MAG: hypothetical protein C0594_08780 [Marinilabiliales bacterium]
MKIRLLFILLLAVLIVPPTVAQRYKSKETFVGIGVGASNYYGRDINHPYPTARMFVDRTILDRYPAMVNFGLFLSGYMLRHESDSLDLYGDVPAYSASWKGYVGGIRLNYIHGGQKWGVRQLHVMAGISLGVCFEEFFERKHTPNDITNLKVDPNYGWKPYYGGYIGAYFDVTRTFSVFIMAGYEESYATIGAIYTFGDKRYMPRFR